MESIGVNNEHLSCTTGRGRSGAQPRREGLDSQGLSQHGSRVVKLLANDNFVLTCECSPASATTMRRQDELVDIITNAGRETRHQRRDEDEATARQRRRRAIEKQRSRRGPSIAVVQAPTVEAQLASERRKRLAAEEALKDFRAALYRGGTKKAIQLSDVLDGAGGVGGVRAGAGTGAGTGAGAGVTSATATAATATAATARDGSETLHEGSTRRFNRLLHLCNTLLAEKDVRREQLESLLAVKDEKLALLQSKLAASDDALARLAESKQRQARAFAAELRVARAEAAELRERAMDAMALEAKISALEAGRERWRTLQAGRKERP